MIWNRRFLSAEDLVAKGEQGQLVAITHNLMLVYEHRLEREHGVSNRAEDRRRHQRAVAAETVAQQAGRAASTLILRTQRATQRSVKFVRWFESGGLSHAMQKGLAEAVAVTRLATLNMPLWSSTTRTQIRRTVSGMSHGHDRRTEPLSVRRAGGACPLSLSYPVNEDAP